MRVLNGYMWPKMDCMFSAVVVARVNVQGDEHDYLDRIWLQSNLSCELRWYVSGT